MTNKNQTRRIIQRMRHVFPLVLVVGMLVLAGGATKVFQQNTPPPTSTSTLSPKPVPHVTYTSSNLGIRFSYLTEVSGVQKFFTREISNKVYLYYNFNKDSFNQPFPGTDADFLNTMLGHGYSVEVFNKVPQQSLIDAIKQQFLAAYAESDCFVHSTHYGHPRQDESFQTAVIDIPRHSTETPTQLSASIAKCPAQYVTGFGVSYFKMDARHPDKLLFIKLGSDNIPSGIKGYTWDGTIEVLK
jgi:hypothetical protein